MKSGYTKKHAEYYCKVLIQYDKIKKNMCSVVMESGRDVACVQIVQDWQYLNEIKCKVCINVMHTV